MATRERRPAVNCGRLERDRAVTREVRRVRPDIMLTFEPSLWSGRRYVNHPDHRAIGEAVLAVVACDAPTRPQFPDLLAEGLDPYSVPELWLATDPASADTRVDIGETLDLKVKAIRAHRSQMENMDDFDPDQKLREWARAVARGADMEYAERFRTFEIEV